MQLLIDWVRIRIDFHRMVLLILLDYIAFFSGCSKAGDLFATCLAVPRVPADGGSDGEGAAGTGKQAVKYRTNPS